MLRVKFSPSIAQNHCNDVLPILAGQVKESLLSKLTMVLTGTLSKKLTLVLDGKEEPPYKQTELIVEEIAAKEA